MSEPTVRELAKMIDHSLLHPTTTDAEVEAGCRLALRYGVATACVKPYSIPQAAELLSGNDVGVCAVIGFPHGNGTTGLKVAEAEAAVLSGAPEIDMVINIGKAKGGAWGYVAREIGVVNRVVVGAGGLVKVIFENDYLEDHEIVRLCEICTEAEVAFVKTSTGYGFVKGDDGRYGYQGATRPHLELMKKSIGPGIRIKAAGGIRTLDDLLAVRELGVSRIGATATRAILDEAVFRGFAEI